MFFGKKKDKIIIMPYRGYASGHRLVVRGRVLEDEAISIREEQSLFQSLRNAYRRFESDEIPLAGVEASFGDATHQVVANEEGYFLFDLPIKERRQVHETWRNIHFKVTTIPKHSDVSNLNIQAMGEILLPSTNASFGIVSDIDDTVLKTDVSYRVRLLRNTLLKSPFQRLPLPGIAAWLRALKKGSHGDDDNPVFYISKSPRNLYDYLEHFLAYNRCPKGPILLRDIGWINNDSFRNDPDYKKDEIISIMDTYPDLPFIFLGDIAGKDPEIYHAIRGTYKDRVLAIFIRDINHPRKQKSYRDWIKENQIDDIHLIRDSISGAKHCLDHGLITTDSFDAVKGEFLV